MWIEFLTVVVGCIIIVLLAHLVIKKTIQLAEYFGLGGTLIGMTILSIGTSLPEIMTDLVGSVQILRDKALMGTVSSLVIGTNVGSDIFQQNFVLAIVAILGTVVIMRKQILPVIGGLIGGTVLLLVLSLNGVLSRWEGGLLIIGYIGYLIYLDKKGLHEKIKVKHDLSKKQIAEGILVLALSFVMMGITANQVLKAAEVLVELLPISASFFGVIFLGVAAALPELTTALVALRKHRKGMSAGVLIGSNITNPTLALGMGAVVSTYTVPNVILLYDLPFKIFGSLLIFWFLWKDRGIRNKQAVILLGLFVAYLVFRNIFFPVDF